MSKTEIEDYLAGRHIAEEMMDIRIAVRADIPSMVELLKELFSIEKDFEFKASKHTRGLEMLLEQTGNAVFVAVVPSGHVIAMATVQTLISTASGGLSGVVEDVIVADSWRGIGIGSHLLARIEHWATERGFKRLQLLADMDNEKAMGFYASQGWEKGSMVVMRKKLE